MYQRSKLGYRSKILYTQRYDRPVHNCKNISLRFKTGEWKTLSTTSAQFTTAEMAAQMSRRMNTSSRAQVCVWNGAQGW